MTTDLTVPENISIVSIEVARHGDTSEITVVDFTVVGEDATGECVCASVYAQPHFRYTLYKSTIYTGLVCSVYHNKFEW